MEVPETAMGYGGAAGEMVALARFCPLAVASEPGAMALAPGLAAESMRGTFAAAVEPAVGVSETPRRTSPALAVRRMVNCCFAATAGSVFANRSVTETSWFGSAP